MPGDISRRTHERRNGYAGVVAQQGRVILDRDVNALQETLRGGLDADALDIIGPCGTPDDGFAIGVPQLSPPSLPFWSPPEPLSFSETSAIDFLISPGTMYLGGRRVELAAEQNGTAITYSYFDQPDWPHPDDPSAGGSFTGSPEIVYLELSEHEVSAVEDPDLLEVALGGPDTTGRLRLLRRIKRRASNTAACATAWQQLVAAWSASGSALDAKTMRLLPQATLQVSFTQDPSTGNPCDPVATGGYLGANNQLIRVQISSAGNTPQLLWGFDDASFLYRVAGIAYGGQALALSADPPDRFHYPQTGQAIEVLRTAAVIASELDDTNPNAPATVVRCVASAAGQVESLLQPYGPVNAGDPNYLFFGAALPLGYQSDTEPLFVRVWQGQQTFTPGTPCELIDPVSGGSTGLQVTIAATNGTALPLGAFWQIAVRPGTPQAVYPEELLVSPQPPDGPSRWACPLAVIDWSQSPAAIADCRRSFENLVTLSNQPEGAGCCTVRVAPQDLGPNRTLQNVIDAAVEQGSSTTVCLSPGSYLLDAPLRLGAQHAGLTLEGCGGIAQLAASAASQAAFGDGVVVVNGASQITLRGLAVTATAVPLSATTGIATFPGVGAIAVRLINVNSVTIERCTFSLSLSGGASITFGAGVFLGGSCSGVTIEHCVFESNLTPTYAEFSLLSRVDSIVGLLDVMLGNFTSGDTTSVNVAFRLIREANDATGSLGPAVVTTFGCLAASSVLQNNNLLNAVCTLDAMLVRDNTFTNLACAVLLQAAMGTVRVEENSVSLCVAGILLLLAGSGAPRGSNLLDPQLGAALGTYEYFYGALVAAECPVNAVPPADAPVTQGAALFVTGNHVNIEPFPFTTVGRGGVVGTGASVMGTSALVVYANVIGTGTGDTTVALFVVSNHLRGELSSGTIPVALLVLPAPQRSAICNNIVRNESPADVLTAPNTGTSLWIAIEGQATNALSVVGNVLQGDTDLVSLTRPTAEGGGTWLAFNAFTPTVVSA